MCTATPADPIHRFQTPSARSEVPTLTQVNPTQAPHASTTCAELGCQRTQRKPHRVLTSKPVKLRGRTRRSHHRSIDRPTEADRYTDRAHFLDNSGNNQEHPSLAEINDGRILEIKARQIPRWFDKAVLHKITSADTKTLSHALLLANVLNIRTPPGAALSSCRQQIQSLLGW
ncbi:MAG: hypothetical protein RLZZ436_414 [Planctomycetota bacterium]